MHSMAEETRCQKCLRVARNALTPHVAGEAADRSAMLSMSLCVVDNFSEENDDFENVR